MDWEKLHGELSQATGAWSREELVGLLRDLIREYVIERGLPTGTPAQAATPDLAQLDFPRLVTWLKRNLELPELDLFSVDGQRVIVDADGPRVLSAGRPATAPRPPAAAPDETPPEPAPAPEPAADPKDARARRKLSKGFRGLEFD